ncbi:hypothetical protein V8J36_10850 [Frigidibacter sp. MR17.14]|uniref:hypothetical protein n=1 Tax=Frigidibacter sp. MR17.14 TaxID=3126509 RepID=UPI003012F87B
MIIGWSRVQDRGDSVAQLLRYETAIEWRKTVAGRSTTLIRDPAPEPLLGETTVVGTLIDALPFRRRHSLAVLSFAATDIPVKKFNGGAGPYRDRIGRVLALFLEAAYAGIPRVHRPPAHVTTHTHTGRLEVNLVLPRMVQRVDGRIMSHNAHPPGAASRKLWDAFTDTVNWRFGFADPRGPDHRRLVAHSDARLKAEAEARRHRQRLALEDTDLIASHARTLYRTATIGNRAELLAAMGPAITKLGAGIEQVSDESVVFRLADGSSRRLKGHLFSDRFTPDHPFEDLPYLDHQDLRRDELSRSPDRLRHALARRAEDNARRYGFEVGVADPLDILNGPPLSLPPRHPGASPTGRTPTGSRMLAVLGRVLAELRRRIETALIATRLVQDGAPLFTPLRQKMEALHARHRSLPRTEGAVRDQSQPRRADRPAAGDPRDGEGAGHQRPAERDDRGPFGDPRPDAQGRGSHGQGPDPQRGIARSRGAPDRDDRRDPAGHRAAENLVHAPAGSRAELLIRLRSAALSTFKRDDIQLRGAPGGRLALSGPGLLATFGSGGVTEIIAESEDARARLERCLEVAGFAAPSVEDLPSPGFN